jgi:autotransporter-associated beta strand protein
MAFSGPLVTAEVAVDPAGALALGSSTWKQTEWESAGNLEGWTSTGVTAPGVAGGAISGTSSNAEPVLQRTNISDGPDLDLAFNDYVDLRIQLPSTYTGDVQLYFGVTDGGGAEGNLTPVLTGFSNDRMVTLPNASIVKDGAFHTYRIDMALEPWWRGKLNDLRIDPATVSGTAFALDFVRIGDTGVVPTAQGMSDLARDVPIPYTLASKHFLFGWNDQTVTDVGMTTAWAKKNLRNAEEAYAIFNKKLGYPRPRWTEAGGPYKINFTSVFDGNFAGGPMLNVGRYELRIDPPTWTIPHELMHVFQGPASGGNVPGDYYELHANYGRELWLQHYQAFFPNQSGLAPGILGEMHMNQPIGRNYYETWPFYLYVDENPDNLPDLGFGTVANIWQQMAAGETNHSALERITPSSSIKDIIGNFARRGLTYNYASKASLRAKMGGGIQPWAQLTEVTQRPDNLSWWQVPAERAPQQAAYTIHALTPTGSGAGRVVSVNFRGLPNAAAGADWRACFIVIADDGSERYSTLWNSGSNSVTLSATENQVYLSVAATPDMYHVAGFDEPSVPYRTHPSKVRFPYEFQVTGATPKETQNGASTGLVQHANGGGYKASTATVASTAYLGPNARVLGTAQVLGTARVEDFAVVRDSSQVLNNAIVRGHANVSGASVLRDNAIISDWALVSNATVSGSARVIEHGSVSNCTLTDNATAKGSALSWGGTASGNAILDGDYGFGRDVRNAAVFGHLPWVGIPDSWLIPLPPNLFAAYEFNAANDVFALDTYAATNGLLRGSPAWAASDAGRNGVRSFNGSNQWVELPRSVMEWRQGTYAFAVKWNGGAANQPVFHFGDGAGSYAYFTPSNSAGVAELKVSNGTNTYSVVSAAPLPIGTWSQVGVSLDGITGVLQIDGVIVGSGPMPVRPDQLLPANIGSAPAHHFLARGPGLPLFNGNLDHFNVYSSAIPTFTSVSVQAMTSSVLETADPVKVRFSRYSLTGSSTSGSLAVNYTVSGTATAGSDYATLSGSATIPDGQSFVDIDFTPIADTLSEGDETVTLTLQASGSFNLGGSPSTTITLLNVSSLSSALLAHYRLDENSGTTASDSSGNNNTATLTNGPTWIPADKALAFDGADDFVQTPVASGTTRTLSAWVRPVSAMNGGNIYSVFDSDVPGAYGTGWGVLDGNFQVILDDEFWDTGVAPTLNQWQLASLTFDASQARFYVNGALVATHDYNQGFVETTSYKIGQSNANGTTFNGSIRDARIYNRAIYGLEAMEIFNEATWQAPRYLTAIAGNSSVALSWTPSNSGTITYTVRRATSTNGPFTTVAGNLSATTWLDTAVTNGTTYYYLVNAGGSADSNQASATPSGTNVPSPWSAANVGTAAGSPTNTFSNGQFAVNGAGAQITAANTTTDSFRFVSIPVMGDCTVIARVEALGSSNGSAKAGVMFRESLVAGSRHAAALLGPSSMSFIRRGTTDGQATTGTTATAITKPWLRIVRTGNSFTASYSANGTSWTTLDQARTVSMSASVVYVGLAVCSGSTTTLSNAVFSNVSITGGFPANLTATAGDSQVKLNWNPVTGAASYKVKRSTTAGGPYTVIGSPTTNTFTDTTAANGTLANPNIFYYVVSAVSASLGESANSLEVMARPDAPLPGTPQGLNAADNGGQVALTWTPVAGAANYRVKRASSPLGPFGAIATVSASSFTDLTAGSVANHFYVVTSVNVSEGESGNSNVASVVRGLYFDPNGTAAGSVVDGGSNAWLTGSWAVALGGTEAVQGWQAGKEARFAATDPGGTLAYSVDISGFDTGSHGNFTGIRSTSGAIQFTGNVSNFYLTTPTIITADPGSSITLAQTRSGADVLAFNLNGQSATFNGDVTVNSAGIGNGGAITANSGTLKLGNAIANFSPGSITVQQGATLLNDGAAGKSFNLNTLTLDGGTLAATNAGDPTRGNFVLTGGLVTGATTTSVISADVRSNGGTDQILNVADTPEAIDLLLSGKLGHFSGSAWSYATKTGPGTMKISGLNALGGLTVTGGKLILEGAGAIAAMHVNSLRNNAQVEISIPTGTVSYTDRTFYGTGSYTKTGPGIFNMQSFSDAPSLAVENGTLHLAGGHNNFWAVTATTVRSGAVLSNNTHSHINALTLDGGELASTGTDATWGGWMLDQDVSVTGSGTSTISAQRVAIANASNVSRIFDVAASATLQITGTFENANTTTANGLTKNGLGTMTLSGTNAYTGPTLVNAGTLRVNGSTAAASALTIADTAILGGTGSIGGAITVNSGATLAPGNSVGTLTAGSASINGTLSIELDGSSADRLNTTGILNITNATLTISGTGTAPEYILASFGSLTGANFANVSGLPGGYEVTIDTLNKLIKLKTVSLTFDSWISQYTVTDPAQTGDPDHDGIANLLEYVLGGDPAQSSTAILPSAVLSGGNWVFTFHRRTASASDTTQIFQYGTDLSGWTDLPISPGASVSITGNNPEAGTDEVTISIPTQQPPKIFGRLKVRRP